MESGRILRNALIGSLSPVSRIITSGNYLPFFPLLLWLPSLFPFLFWLGLLLTIARTHPLILLFSTHMMAKADDSIVPSNEQIQSILIKSRHCWQRYVKQVTEQSSTLLDSIELRDLLDRVPAIRHGRRLKRNGRTVFGQSTWNFKPQDRCSLGEFIGDLKPLTIGIMRHTICTTEGSCFHHWRGDAFDGREADNSLAILTFA